MRIAPPGELHAVKTTGGKTLMRMIPRHARAAEPTIAVLAFNGIAATPQTGIAGRTMTRGCADSEW